MKEFYATHRIVTTCHVVIQAETIERAEQVLQATVETVEQAEEVLPATVKEVGDMAGVKVTHAWQETEGSLMQLTGGPFSKPVRGRYRCLTDNGPWIDRG